MSASTDVRTVAAMAGSVIAAMLGAVLWRVCGLPLPWLVGSLYAVAFARIAGVPLLPPPAAKQGGQWVIGTNMGLYFTSTVAAELLVHAPLIVGMAIASVLMGMLGAAALLRLRLADAATAFFAAMPGGASEMASLSDLWQASVDRVAAAHATRVMLVVLVVPLAVTVVGADAAPAVVRGDVDWLRLALVAAASLAGVALFRLVGIPNAWVLGTLAVVAGMGIGGMRLSALPAWLAAAGQMLIGISLGCRFGPGFVRRSPAFLSGILGVSVGFLLATAVGAAALASMADLTFPNLLLSFAPGGIAEMSITASRLNLDVPLVVASHIVRMTLLTMLAPGIFRLFARLCRATISRR